VTKKSRTLFICRKLDERDQKSYTLKPSLAGAELIIHEVSHAVLGTHHEGLSDSLNTNSDVPMSQDCMNPMGLNTTTAVNNAYSLEAFVACVAGSLETPFRKDLSVDARMKKEEAAKWEQTATDAAALSRRRRRRALALKARIESGKKIRHGKEKHVTAARDLLLLDRVGQSEYRISARARKEIIAIHGKVVEP